MSLKLTLPKINLVSLRKVILTLLLFGLAFGAGYYVAAARSAKSLSLRTIISRELPLNQKDLNFSLFWKVWDTLSAAYFDKEKLIPAKMVYGAIQGMVAAVGDPYTIFLPPEENKMANEDLQGDLEGVGIQIGYKGTQLVVIAPLPGSPAEKAGVEAGDFIVGIKDEAKKIDTGTVGMGLTEAVRIIRGPAGSKVTLGLLREGHDQVIVLEMTREKIVVPSVVLSFVGEKETLAQIKLNKFAGNTNGEWESVVTKILTRPGVKGIILDLRNNPGGYLQGSVDTASEFLATGSLVVVQENANGSKEEFKVRKLGRLINLPLVVIVNKGSASASEILAGALRDDRQIKIVGETTFGKGTIQEPQDLEGGAGLHITVARWLTPSGYWVNEKGLEPDVKIKDNEETKEDEQLNAAIQLFN